MSFRDSLDEAREQADYDDGATFDFARALNACQSAESAYLLWMTAQADPTSTLFLQELFYRSVVKR